MHPDQPLLHYRLTAQIGEGGMGVVWRATDTTLDREVALKILPEQFATDPDRMARLEREAKLLASLNHPNIATIHGLHEADTEDQGKVRFLAMELIPGEDLAPRLARGALPVEDALQIAAQIARALQAAHEKGIVHRDLKPGNIHVLPDGTVKVLDFGLAKTVESDRTSVAADPQMSPTLTSAGTMAGVIMGTAGYMSPEQARGKPVDRRADIWALGVVLFEMLTGSKTFPGEDISEILAGVIKSDPDWPLLPAELPRPAQTVLRRCLRRKPDERFGDASAVRILIEEALEERESGSGIDSREATAAASAPSRGTTLLPWALLAATLLAAVAGFWWPRANVTPSGPPPIAARFHLDLPDDGQFHVSWAPYLDITPDGRQIVYAGVVGEQSGLYVRDLDSFTAGLLPGTDKAVGPFIAPDGEWVGFVSDGKLRKISLRGLTPIDICDQPDSFRGGSWGEDGSIVFARDLDSGLWRIAPGSDTPEELTTPDRDAGESSHLLPHVLPQNKGVAFRINGAEMTGVLALLSYETGKITKLVEHVDGPIRYVEDGYLLIRRDGQLVALPFDLDAMKTTGSPIPLLDDVDNGGKRIATFAVAGNGTLAYSTTTFSSSRQPVWVDRQGNETPLDVEPIHINYPKLSPDNRRLTWSQENQIWIYRIEGGQRMRLTMEGTSFVPVWFDDGRRLAFGSYRPEENLYWQSADGSGKAELLLEQTGRQYPAAWHAPTRRLVMQWIDVESGYDIWTVNVDGDPKAEPLLDSRFNERWPTLSPDGRWIAFSSDESGSYEIYVRPFPEGGGKWAVSTHGGTEPIWSPKGDEIFFNVGSGLERTRIMAVSVNADDAGLRFGSPVELFDGNYSWGVCCGHSYDVASDGQRFVLLKVEDAGKPRMSVVQDALAVLRRD